MKAESNYVLALRKMQQDKTAANPNPPKTNQHEENCYKVDGYLQQNPFCAQICVDNSGEGRRAGAPAPAGSAGGGYSAEPSREGLGEGEARGPGRTCIARGRRQRQRRSPRRSPTSLAWLRALKMTDDGRHARTPR